MAEVWLPGAIVRPGALAGYARGRTRMQWCVCHFTVGRDSTGIGLQGYFHILFPKDGPPIQFAEIDALTWHAGNWNPWGPGAEWERMPTGEYVRDGLQRAEPLTDDQITWGARWVDLCAEWGIPKVHYPGPRYAPDTWAGQVNHGDIDPNRSDGLTDAEWDMIAGGVPPQPQPEPPPDLSWLLEDTMAWLYCDTDGMFAKGGLLYAVDTLGAMPCPNQAAVDTPGAFKVPTGTIDGLIGDRLRRAEAFNIKL